MISVASKRAASHLEGQRGVCFSGSGNTQMGWRSRDSETGRKRRKGVAERKKTRGRRRFLCPSPSNRI